MSESSLSTKWAFQLRPSYCSIIIIELMFLCECCREELANILYMCSSSCCGSEQFSESFHQSRCRAWTESHATQTSGLHHLQQWGGPIPEVLARHSRYTQTPKHKSIDFKIRGLQSCRANVLNLVPVCTNTLACKFLGLRSTLLVDTDLQTYLSSSPRGNLQFEAGSSSSIWGKFIWTDLQLPATMQHDCDATADRT